MKNKKISLESLKTILKDINYPGFNRDIVSFGMVKNISFEDSNINISLQVNSDNKQHLIQLENQKSHVFKHIIKKSGIMKTIC